jgi:hypothetical protein
MSWVVAGFIAGATIYDIYSSNKTSEEQAELAKQQARAKQEQAREYYKRATSNAEDFLKEGRSYLGRVRELYTVAGVEGGSTLDVLSSSWAGILDSFYEQLEDAQYNARMLELGAQIDMQEATLMQRGANREQFGKILSGGAKIGQALKD